MINELYIKVKDVINVNKIKRQVISVRDLTQAVLFLCQTLGLLCAIIFLVKNDINKGNNVNSLLYLKQIDVTI